MIRLVNVLRRQPNMSFAEFNDYWLNEHGPKVVVAAEQLGLKRYVQLHSLEAPDGPTHDPLRGEMLEPYDGVEDYWFPDMETLLKAETLLGANSELFQSEQQFVDHPASAAWISYEVPHINPTPEDVIATNESNIVKLFYVLNQPQAMSVADAQFYWRVQHGPLVRQAGPQIQTLRYIQVHALEHEFNERLQRGRGLGQPFYGHAELWFDLSRSAKPEAKDAGVMLYEDETNFIDFSRSAIWYGKEQVLVAN
ncbi:MAG: EthD domain-containing protein [Pseudomonadales bacterium]